MYQRIPSEDPARVAINIACTDRQRDRIMLNPAWRDSNRMGDKSYGMIP
jgi:hypothetical protein